MYFDITNTLSPVAVKCNLHVFYTGYENYKKQVIINNMIKWQN